MFTLQREMTKQGHDFAIFALTYTLSPGGVYPLQLKQAALALNHLLKQEHRDPATVCAFKKRLHWLKYNHYACHLLRPHGYSFIENRSS